VSHSLFACDLFFTLSFIFLKLTWLVVVLKFINFRFALFTPPLGDFQRHHEAGEWDLVQPVSRDEVSEVGETLDERVFRERRNSRRRDRRQAQDRDREQAKQGARLRRENPLFARNLNPNFARAMNTPSKVGGVLAQIADGLLRTPDAEGYRRLLTRAANHRLPIAHPPSDLRHAINSR
jgi:hypothetical protein